MKAKFKCTPLIQSANMGCSHIALCFFSIQALLEALPLRPCYKHCSVRAVELSASITIFPGMVIVVLMRASYSDAYPFSSRATTEILSVRMQESRRVWDCHSVVLIGDTRRN